MGGMTLRIFLEPQQGATYDQLLAAATTAQECGYGAFFRSDHFLKMGDPPGVPNVTDAWITLAGLARDTSTIRLGTMVTPVTFRAIGSFAITVAQVDHMSGGRVEVGLGTGWYHQEHHAFALDYPALRDRMDRLDDQISILDGVWSTPRGETFRLEGATASVEIAADTVRPLQQPGPPLILGGAGKPRSALLATAYASEYNTGFQSPEATKEIHDRVRAACERAGRDPASMVFSAALTACCGVDDADFIRHAAAIGRNPDDLRSGQLGGTPGEIVEKLASYAEAGVERFYLQLLDVTDLEQIQLIASEVMPHAPGV
jgi:alkanesulfonate monooxygenase